jgi:hypothetical protein
MKEENYLWDVETHKKCGKSLIEEKTSTQT